MEIDGVPVSDSVRTAVTRALSQRQRDALTEIEQILDATLRVAERMAPAEPRVADIVAEAKTSNKTFYRYFATKQDVLLAVVERGLIRLHGYLQHRLAACQAPPDQLATWAEGILGQVSDPAVAYQSIAVMRQVAAAGGLRDPASTARLDDLGALLLPALESLGRAAPERDVRALQDVLLGALQRHVLAGTPIGPEEAAHLVDFCLAAVGLAGPGRPGQALMPGR
jgi:AcrR family transcriptional regulator